MALSAKIELIDRDVALILRDDLSPAARSRALAEFAREQINAASEQNRKATGSAPHYTTFVDGSEGRPIEQVRPDGIVVAEFDLIGDMLTWIGAELERVSPRLRGVYARSHILLADGQEVAPSDAVPDAAELVFVSTVPYARKIEGSNSRPPQSRQAPRGVYEITAAKAKSRFGNVARIKFSFRSVVGNTALDRWARRTRMRPNRTNKQSARGFGDWLRRQPAIVVTFRDR